MTETGHAEEAYNQLFERISNLYETTKESLVSANWQTGKYLEELKTAFPEHAGHGKSYIKKLAEDLSRRHGKGFSITSLKNMRRFYRYFPFGQPVAQMEMSKHLLLMTVKDETAREEFTRQALEGNLTRFELKSMIDVYRLNNLDKEKLREEDFDFLRGDFYRYRRVFPKGPEQDRSITVDCGFNVLRNIEVVNREKAATSFLFKTEKRNGKYFIQEILEDTADEKNRFFTYKARVEKIIDGDTLWLNIDIGFDTVIRQKIRLRGVDTPEINFDEGKRARDFVKRQLGQTSFIVIKTYKTDRYDRYIADLFYLKNEEDHEKICSEGILLNREIIQKGYGRRIYT